MAANLPSSRHNSLAEPLSSEQSLHRASNIPRVYSRIEPLASPAPPPDNELSILKIAKEILSSVNPGSDVTNINLPATVLDPVSTLEKTKMSMQRGELLQDVCNPKQSQLTRFLNVMRFNISGLARERFGKKPYNPVLGEIYRCCFVHRENGGVTVLIAEQVSHHPPITALHLRNETLGFYMNSHTAPEPRVWANSLVIKLPGEIRVYLETFDEEYIITRPDIYMTGFIFGRQRLEFNGMASFKCERSGYGAEIEYKARGPMAYRAEMNGISGRVFQLSSGNTLYTLDGHWDKIITLTNSLTGEQTVLFDYEKVVFEKSILAVLPLEHELEESFSTVVWKDCSKAIVEGETFAANAAKRKVEEHQRRLRKERASAEIQWKYHYFTKRANGADGYDLRDDLKKLSHPKLMLSKQEIDALRSGETVNSMISEMVGNGKGEGNEEESKKGRFRLKLTGKTR